MASDQGRVGLTLADGFSWQIIATDEPSLKVVERLSEVMRLGPANGNGQRILLSMNGEKRSSQVRRELGRVYSEFIKDHLPIAEAEGISESKGNPIRLRLGHASNQVEEGLQLMQIASCIALDSQLLGGMLMHGALIEREGLGVILAGPGGVGKTTACRRLQSPWRALCDDVTLIVRDQEGRYWAHPWPTWSRFFSDCGIKTWEVERAVPLMACCFIYQASEVQMRQIGEGEAVCEGIELVEQTNPMMVRFLNPDALRHIRHRQLLNLCGLMKSISAYRLHLDMEGAFWEDLEDQMPLRCRDNSSMTGRMSICRSKKARPGMVKDICAI